MSLPYHSRVAIFASPAAGITAIEIVHFTTLVLSSPQVTRCVHWGQWAYAFCFEHEHWSISIFCVRVGAHVYFLYESVINMLFTGRGGSYWVRLCLRSWVPLLKKECTVFPSTDWPRLVNNNFFLKLHEMFSKRTVMIEGWNYGKDPPWNEQFSSE